MNLDFDAVQEVLETRVAPQLALHGGGVKLCSISPEGDIRVAFKGACATCPSMTETMESELPLSWVSCVQHSPILLSI